MGLSRRTSILALITVLVLLVSGCMRVEQDISIDDDGSGQITTLAAMNTAVIEGLMGDDGLAQGFGEELGGAGELFGFGAGGDLCEEISRGMAEENFNDLRGLAEPYVDGDFCGVRFTGDLPAAADHSAALEEFLESPRLEKVGENWEFEGTLADDTSGLGDAGDLGAAAGAFGGGADGFGDINALLGGFEYTLTLDLPGEAIEGAHNATSVDGGRFTWEVDLMNPPDRFFASTQPGGFSFPWALLFALLIIGLIVAGVIWFFTNDKAKEGTSLKESLGEGLAPSDATNPYTAAGAAGAAGTAGVGGLGTSAPLQQQASAATATATLDPVYDESLGAWVVFHPEQGRLRHDPVTGQWVPA